MTNFSNTHEIVAVPGQGAGVESPAYLGQTAWQQLAAASNAEDFANQWLVLQCAMISGALRAVVVWRDETGFRPLAEWPENQRAIKANGGCLGNGAQRKAGCHQEVQSPGPGQ